jgi:hypothetical protein
VKTLTSIRCQLKTFKDGLSKELNRVKTTRDLLVNRVDRSLRQKRVILGSIIKPLNYTSRRAYKTTTSFFSSFFSFSLKHRLLYASYRRVFSLRGTSSFFTRLDASFLSSSLSISMITRNQ